MRSQLLPTATARDTGSFAWSLVRDRRLPLAVTVLAFVGAGLAGLVPPWLIGRLVDAVRAGTESTQRSWPRSAPGSPP